MIEKLKDFEIYIFDFDGTLINSEPFHKKAHNLVLNEILGKEIVLTDQMFSKYIGKSDIQIYDEYKVDFHVDFDKDKMIAKKVAYATDLLSDDSVKIFDYFFELAKEKGNKRFYIVSNQDYNLLMKVLEQKGIKKYFDKIFSLPKLGVKKDYFLQNLDLYIDHSTRKTIIFEDSNAVLGLAKQLGMFAVGIETYMNAGKLSNADTIIKCE